MGLTYKDSGVDKTKGYEEVSLIKNLAESTYSKNVLSGIGGFGAMFGLDVQNYKEPVLVSGTDGVGTKLIVAQDMDVHDSCGIDLVAMCVNDVICQGAKPLFFLDYIATGKLEPKKMEGIVKGVVDGVKMADCSLIGGETAEMPDMYGEDDYDLAGFVVGIVDKSKIIDGKNVKAGDKIIALESSGIHSNGFSLVRKIVFDKMGYSSNTEIKELETTVGKAILEPTRIYVKDVLSLIDKVEVKAIANITGGGLYENIPRCLGNNFDAKIDLSNYEAPEIFKLLQKWGEVEDEEMYGTFNMGIGMVLVVSPENKGVVLDHFKEYKAFEIGEVVEGTGEVQIEF